MGPLTIGALMLALFGGQQDVSLQERSEGYVSLFDGATLGGWHAIPLGAAPGTWGGKDGVLTHTPGDSWLASDRTYTDFILRLEYRTGDGSDSGIFMRSTPDGYPSFTGMEIEIRNDVAQPPTPRSNTGDLRRRGAARQRRQGRRRVECDRDLARRPEAGRDPQRQDDS